MTSTAPPAGVETTWAPAKGAGHEWADIPASRGRDDAKGSFGSVCCPSSATPDAAPVADPQPGRAGWRRGCITAPSGCQGDTAARSEATQISRVPRPVVSGHPAVGVCDPRRSCPVSRGCASLSGRGCTPVWNVLVPISGPRACARSRRPPRPIGCQCRSAPASTGWWWCRHPAGHTSWHPTPMGWPERAAAS